MKSFIFKDLDNLWVQGEVGKLLFGQVCFAHSVVEYQLIVDLRKRIR